MVSSYTGRVSLPVTIKNMKRLSYVLLDLQFWPGLPDISTND